MPDEEILCSFVWRVKYEIGKCIKDWKSKKCSYIRCMSYIFRDEV